jgi:cytochrome c peroxidase
MQRNFGWPLFGALMASAMLAGCSDPAPARLSAPRPTRSATRVEGDNPDSVLQAYLASRGFTGRIAETLDARLGRPLDHQLADLGRQLWFDPIQALNNDNTCAGCHSPTNGFGDTQPIAIGIESNRIVGPGRMGPRNQRRAPMVINTAFLPDADVELTLPVGLRRSVR